MGRRIRKAKERNCPWANIKTVQERKKICTHRQSKKGVHLQIPLPGRCWAICREAGLHTLTTTLGESSHSHKHPLILLLCICWCHVFWEPKECLYVYYIREQITAAFTVAPGWILGTLVLLWFSSLPEKLKDPWGEWKLCCSPGTEWPVELWELQCTS